MRLFFAFTGTPVERALTGEHAFCQSLVEFIELRTQHQLCAIDSYVVETRAGTPRVLGVVTIEAPLSDFDYFSRDRVIAFNATLHANGFFAPGGVGAGVTSITHEDWISCYAGVVLFCILILLMAMHYMRGKLVAAHYHVVQETT